MKRIILKFGCLLLLTVGIFTFAESTPASASACTLLCPEGTVCEGFGDNQTCTCVCFDQFGYCTYSWSYCPTNPWVRK